MVIDFEQIKEQVIQGFKGGVGELRTKSFADDKRTQKEMVTLPLLWRNK